MSWALVGDSLLIGLEERLSLGKGLGERLLTSLEERKREETDEKYIIKTLLCIVVSVCAYAVITQLHCVLYEYLSCSMAFSVLK